MRGEDAFEVVEMGSVSGGGLLEIAGIEVSRKSVLEVTDASSEILREMASSIKKT